MDAGIGNGGSGRERVQLHRDLGQFADRWRDLWLLCEHDLGQHLFGDSVGMRLDPQHLASHCCVALRTQQNPSRQLRAQAMRALLVESHMDPQPGRFDHLHHRLPGDDGCAAIGVAARDETVHRRDQAQIGALLFQCGDVGACTQQVLARRVLVGAHRGQRGLRDL